MLGRSDCPSHWCSGSPSGSNASTEWSASPEHLGRELTEVEVVPPNGNESIVDFDDPHHRQRSGCSVGSREVVDALCHDDRAFGHHVDHLDIDLTTYSHELSEGRFDGSASSDWDQRNVVIDAVFVEE